MILDVHTRRCWQPRAATAGLGEALAEESRVE